MLCVFFLGASGLFAQDVLITQNGDVIKAYETELGPSSVFYKASEDPQAPLQKIALADLLMIKYQDGTRWVAGETTPSAEPVAAAPASKPVVGPENQAEIDKINKLDIQYVAEPSESRAKIIFNLYKIQPGSILADENVTMHFASTSVRQGALLLDPEGEFTSYEGALSVFLQSKTDKVIYVDLGNSFFTRGRDTETCYVPSATSSGQTTSTGVSVNMGASGGGSSVLDGVTVGKGVSNSTSKTVYSQRIISIPPMSEKEIGTFQYLPRPKEGIFGKQLILGLEGGRYYLRQKLNKEDIPSIGETKVNNDEDYLPFRIYISYSFNEQQTHPAAVNANLRLDRMIGVKSGKQARNMSDKVLSPNYKDAIFMITSASTLK